MGQIPGNISIKLELFPCCLDRLQPHKATQRALLMSAEAQCLYYRMPASRCPHLPQPWIARQCWLIARFYSEKDDVVRSYCNSPRKCTHSKIRQSLQCVEARCRRRSPAASKISSLSGHASFTCNKPWLACCMESR
jgi:hypothetical protein